MYKIFVEHIINYFDQNNFDTCKATINRAIEKAGNEHYGYGVINYFNGKAKQQYQNAILILSELDDEEQYYQVLLKICNDNYQNDPSSIISNWNISSGAWNSYSSFNTKVMRCLLLEMGILDILYESGSLSYEDSEAAINEKIEVFSKKTFLTLINHFGLLAANEDEIILVEKKPPSMFAEHNHSPEIISRDYE
ncbi:MAG: hypothetical protein EP298_05895 [Gammaproteobacteria bacterium]|nr:MAG: hypothetical protein EP298_05895 [Gammaproteobacteria bacterium]UTW41412.1 hypothetical protein KFE69_07770 [bacterium SCSIO 12844]